MMSGITGAAAVGALHGEAEAQGNSGGDVYELRTYHLETEAQRDGLDAFLAEAAIPALNRMGVKPVGVFHTVDEISPVYVLMRHASMASVGAVTATLGNDEEFLSKGAAFLDAPAKSPAYTRMESAILKAFDGMPKIERPVTNDGRVFQLRIYESPSVKTGQKKIEMFNTAEIDIFRKTGLTPVLFGEAIAGVKMPNLTYMLSFESIEAQKAAWSTFVNSPEWKELSALPEYANDKILCGITNILLKPAACSQL
jgi:hypothetical protein